MTTVLSYRNAYHDVRSRYTSPCVTSSGTFAVQTAAHVPPLASCILLAGRVSLRLRDTAEMPPMRFPNLAKKEKKKK